MEVMSKIKQERSISVQSRVDVVMLAEIFLALQGKRFNVRTMSLLISYCVEIAHSALEKNEWLERRVESLGDAYYLLADSGVMTRKTRERNDKKFNMAQGFENLRREGVNPETYAPGAYKMLHNTHSVETVNPLLTRSKAQEMVDNYEKLERQRMIEEDRARNEERRKTQEYNPDGTVKTLPPYQYRETPPITSEEVKRGRPPKPPTTESPECGYDELQNLKPDELTRRFKAMSVEDRKKMLEQLKPKSKQKVVRDSDIPRAKTEEELQADAERIAKKDRDLMAALDQIPKAPPRTSSDASE